MYNRARPGFKQFEFDDLKMLMIAAHTDTSGDFKINFTISEERALNTYHLLMDNKSEWTVNCAARQKIEDYQQVLTFVNNKKELGIDCDPGKIDNVWGPKTKDATERYLKATCPDTWQELLEQISNESQHKWMEEVWAPVFDIYLRVIREYLCCDDAELVLRRKSIRFVDPARPYMACGESFPIDKSQQQNYRSQTNRRVEFLFFDDDEIAPEDICCPVDVTSRAHKDTECPFWPLTKKIYYVPCYISPNDLKCISYHFSFSYFDRIKQKSLPIPEVRNLSIKAFENGTTEVPTTVNYKKGVYLVKLQFTDSVANHPRKNLHFTFTSADSLCSIHLQNFTTHQQHLSILQQTGIKKFFLRLIFQLPGIIPGEVSLRHYYLQ